MSFWCLLASASAGAMYWAALRLFDLQLGRMSETSKKPTAPQPRGLYIADGGLQADGAARADPPLKESETASRSGPASPDRTGSAIPPSS